MPVVDGVCWFGVMLEVAFPRPLAQGWPLSVAVHQSQLGKVCTAEMVCAPAGTPGGPAGGAGVDGELLDCDGWLFEAEDCEELEDDDEGALGGSAGWLTGGNCEATTGDVPPPQPANRKRTGRTRITDHM